MSGLELGVPVQNILFWRNSEGSGEKATFVAKSGNCWRKKYML